MIINGYEFDYLSDEFVKKTILFCEEYFLDSDNIEEFGSLKYTLNESNEDEIISVAKKMISYYCSKISMNTMTDHIIKINDFNYLKEVEKRSYEKYGSKYWTKKQCNFILITSKWELYGLTKEFNKK